MAYSIDDKRPAKIFISHSSVDHDFAKAVIDLLTAIGINQKGCIMCTSESGYGIKVGHDWVNDLFHCFKDYRTYVIIIHSSHLYSSPVSMNEMGAAWVEGCPIFSFLVNGFMESSLSGVLTGNHQGVLVGRKDISPDLDQLKDAVTELFGIESVNEEKWKDIKKDFIRKISSLPADKGFIKKSFDINKVELIHLHNNDIFEDNSKDEQQNVTWQSLLKVLAPALRTPHSENALREELSKAYPGITEDDITEIIDKLHSFGLAEAYTVSSEYEGISVAWTFTEEGRNAYERANNYHSEAIYQNRDKAQVEELMTYFSTYAMDEYIKEGPDYINDYLLISSDMWRGIIGSSAFQIFNPTLNQVLKEFYEIFSPATSHGECYIPANNRKYKLVQPAFGAVNKENEKTIRWLYKSKSVLVDKYNKFIEYIKKYYPEIDLKKTSEEFEQQCNS